MDTFLQVWRLAWNLITFKEVTQAVRFNEQPIYTNGLRQLAHAAKYLEKMHTTNNTLVAAVGDRDIDHLIEDDRPLVGEQFLGANVPRPVIMLNQTSGGADLIAEACSAFAALGILFREQDPDYSNLMIKHARQLYDWMVAVPGTQYSRVDPMLQQTYPSEVRFTVNYYVCSMLGSAELTAPCIMCHITVCGAGSTCSHDACSSMDVPLNRRV